MNREIQCLVTKTSVKLWESGKKKLSDFQKFRKVFEHFQEFWFKCSYFFILSKPDKRNWDITYQWLIPSLLLQPQGQSRCICSPPESQHDSSFPATTPATWAGSAVAWMVHIFQSLFYLIINYFPWGVLGTY